MVSRMDSVVRFNELINNFSFDVLEDVLKDSFPPHYYSLGEYADLACCIEEHDSKWIIYFGERGLKHNLVEKNNIWDACLYFIEVMATSKEECRMLQEKFYNIVKRILSTNTSNRTFETAVAYETSLELTSYLSSRPDAAPRTRRVGVFEDA